jgi:hypothetical protein
MPRPELDALIEEFRSADVLGLPSVEATREALDEIGHLNPVAPEIRCQSVKAGRGRSPMTRSATCRVAYWRSNGAEVGRVRLLAVDRGG